MNLDRRLHASRQRRLEQQQKRLEIAQRALQAVNPQATLERGYAIVTGPQGEALHTAYQIEPGARIEVRLAKGRIRGKVIKILD
jgi:exodeoxyribonuclease VII large subunit